MSLEKYKNRLLYLEAQNKELKRELRFYKRKLIDTQQSRQHWKAKYSQKQCVTSSLKEAAWEDCLWGNQAVKHHSYSLLLVAFCANIQGYGQMSLRGCVHVLLCLQLALGGQRRLPSHNSIRSWVCKLGLYRIQHCKDSSEQWLYWVDESIHLGSEKILLILGICQQDLDLTQALSLSNLRILHMQVSEHWKGEQIGLVLQELNHHYPISYIVSDEGHNLKRAYDLTGFTHVPDVTHRLSKGIEKAYRDQPLFNEFCHWAGSLRKKWSLNSSRRDYLPPAQRSKARFANLFPWVNYAQKHLQNWQKIPGEVKTEFAFLQTYCAWADRRRG